MTPPAVVLFDGSCNLCDGAVRFSIARDRGGRLRYAALDSEAGRAQLERFGRTGAVPQSIVLIDSGRLLEESDAVLRIAELLGAPWSWAAAARLLPRGVRDVAYRVVARNRYRIFGRRTACRLPTASERARFL